MKKYHCKLVFIEKMRTKEDIEHYKTIKCDIYEVFSSKYFQALDRDIQLSNTIKVDSKNLLMDGKYPIYAEINAERFKINKISDKGRYTWVDLEEMK